MIKDLKICVLSEYAYSLLSGITNEIGGAELQMTMLAKALVKKSYDVSFVSFGNSPYFTQINGLNVYNPFDIQNNGYNYLKPTNMVSLFKTLRKIDADIYIQRGVTPLTGLVAFFCKLNKKKFIYSVASDAAVSSYLNIETIQDIEKIVYKTGVRLSNEIVCQSNVQRDLLNKRGKKSVLIKNAYIPPSLSHGNEDEVRSIWVGRTVKEKRPDLYLRLAEKIPEYKFLMVGAPSTKDCEYYKFIKKEAEKINNLQFLGFVPHNKINEYYSKSAVLINTSPGEGFPNTFLEAWGNSIPVVSFVNPDNIISNNKLGICVNNFDEMVENTIKLLENKDLRIEMGSNGRNYVLNEHSFDNVLDSYERLFEKLVLTPI